MKGDGAIDPLHGDSGKIRFMADRTRPDILFAASQIGSGASDPHRNHVRGLEHLAKYLRSSEGEGLTLGGDPEIELFGFSDASFISHGDSKSQLAYCFFLNRTSGTISCRTKKDTTVSHSSCDAELKALDEAVRAAIWLRNFLTELGFPPKAATTIYIDNSAAKELVETFRVGSKSGHITTRINYIHEQIQAGAIAVEFIDTINQMADILTKAQPTEPFTYQRDFLLHGFGGKPIPRKTHPTAKRSILKPRQKGDFRPKSLTRKRLQFIKKV